MIDRLAPFAAALVACRPTIDTASTTPVESTCVDSVSDSVLDAQVAVMLETASSYHEMVACGSLAFQLSASVEQILLGTLLESNGVDMPSSYVYDGQGRYVTSSGGTTMYVSYLFGDNFAVGNEDDLIVDNLFDFDNYLQGVSATLDLLAQELLVSYTSVGPLVELLGEGATPPNPLHLTVEDIEAPYQFGRLKMVIEVACRGCPHGSDRHLRARCRSKPD